MLIAGGVTWVLALPARQVKVIRCKIRSMQLVLSRWLLRRQQVNSQRRYNGPCDLILNLEDVIQLAIVGLRPDVVAVVGANQLRGDAKGAAGFAYTPFEDVRNGERLGYIGDGRLLAFEVERRSPRWHP